MDLQQYTANEYQPTDDEKVDGLLQILDSRLLTEEDMLQEKFVSRYGMSIRNVMKLTFCKQKDKTRH